MDFSYVRGESPGPLEHAAVSPLQQGSTFWPQWLH
jgi:hypothetical protein